MYALIVLNRWFLGAWTGEDALIYVSIIIPARQVFQPVAQAKGLGNILAGGSIMTQRWLNCVSSCFKGSNFQVCYYSH